MSKLTDFGLHGLRAASSSITKNSHQYFRSKLWTAPEVLRSDPELLQVAALLQLKIYEPQLRLLAAVLHGALPPAAGVACGGRGGRGDDQGGRVQVEVYRCTVYSVLSPTCTASPSSCTRSAPGPGSGAAPSDLM